MARPAARPHRSRTRRAAAAATLSTLVLGCTTALVDVPSASAIATRSRLAGADRFETAARIVERAFPTGAPVVYLARADAFPDALAAGALSDGPVLLVPRSGAVPAVVLESVQRLAPRTVVALGDANAVGDDVLAAVAGGRATRRLGGADRYATAALVARAAFPGTARTVYLTRGDTFPDALSAGSLTDGPVLLVPSTGEVPDVVLREVQRLAPQRVVALGDERAVAADVLDSAAAGRPTSRLGGADRYATSAAIARAAFPAGAPVTYLARADAFPDALAAGALRDGPVLLMPTCEEVPASGVEALRALDASHVVALGNGQAVCDRTLINAYYSVQPSTRYLGEQYFGGNVAGWWFNRQENVDGTLYDYATRAVWSGRTTESIPLDGGYARFRTTVETPGERPQDEHLPQLDVVVDGRVVSTTVLGVGAHRDLDVDVTGAQEVQLVLHAPEATGPYPVVGVTLLGNPRVVTATGVDDGPQYTHAVVPQQRLLLADSAGGGAMAGQLTAGRGVLGGVTYEHAVLGFYDEHAGFTGELTDRRSWRLSRAYRRLTTVVGMADDSEDPTAHGRLEVVLDGRLAHSVPFTVGRPVPVDVDITGVLDLELRTVNSAPGAATPVLADPVVTP
ncbi:cell wall-binding repeat-containing protein [Kineococcus gypseus]|uniref:cell wall-binding repeat-containing protein n=1 Tax=Kineococcus gypseus TaxID=1637102 RepID=UPI003D7F0D29